MIENISNFDELIKNLKDFSFEELLNINEILTEPFFQKSEKVKYEVVPLVQSELDRRFKDNFLNMTKDDQRQLLDDYLTKFMRGVKK